MPTWLIIFGRFSTSALKTKLDLLSNVLRTVDILRSWTRNRRGEQLERIGEESDILIQLWKFRHLLITTSISVEVEALANPE